MKSINATEFEIGEKLVPFYCFLNGLRRLDFGHLLPASVCLIPAPPTAGRGPICGSLVPSSQNHPHP